MKTSAYSFGNRTAIRLREKTRKFAYESLYGKYGTDALKTPYVTLDDIENFDTMSNLEKYDTAIRKIVTDAPIRIVEDELILRIGQFRLRDLP